MDSYDIYTTEDIERLNKRYEEQREVWNNSSEIMEENYD